MAFDSRFAESVDAVSQDVTPRFASVLVFTQGILKYKNFVNNNVSGNNNNDNKRLKLTINPRRDNKNTNN
jgi:hypothetical protein